MEALFFFEKEILKDIKDVFGITKIEYQEKGDFGYLTRFDLYSKDKISNIDFWSEGWVGGEVFKIVNFDLMYIYNKLLAPEEYSNEFLIEIKKVLLNE